MLGPLCIVISASGLTLPPAASTLQHAGACLTGIAKGYGVDSVLEMSTLFPLTESTHAMASPFIATSLEIYDRMLVELSGTLC